MPLQARALLACLVLVPLLGCSAGPVEIDAPSLTAAEARACDDLVTALPDEVAGQGRREVTGDASYGAAWGDPAIVLTCGVGQPDDFDSTSTCIEANGVGWFVPDSVLLDDDETIEVTMTAVGFRPRVEVLLPGDYRPDGFLSAAGALGEVVGDELDLADPCV